MKTALRIEDIKSTMRGDYYMFYRLLGGKSLSRAWVAEITGFDTKFNYQREFINPYVDYSKSNSVGSRGVYKTFLLDENGLYDVAHPVSWKRTLRYFCTVRDGKIIKISEEELKECLRNRSE